MVPARLTDQYTCILPCPVLLCPAPMQLVCAAGAEEHGAVDLWLLMLLASLGGRRCEAVQKLLKKKFTDGHAGHTWLDSAFAAHPVGLLCQQSLCPPDSHSLYT